MLHAAKGKTNVFFLAYCKCLICLSLRPLPCHDYENEMNTHIRQFSQAVTIFNRFTYILNGPIQPSMTFCINVDYGEGILGYIKFLHAHYVSELGREPLVAIASSIIFVHFFLFISAQILSEIQRGSR
jgi:hypothetical protein